MWGGPEVGFRARGRDRSGVQGQALLVTHRSSPSPSLQYIHSAGIVHRVGVARAVGGGRPVLALRAQPLCSGLCPPAQDLKPSNVAVNEDCELRVSTHGPGRLVGGLAVGRRGLLRILGHSPDPGLWTSPPG